MISLASSLPELQYQLNNLTFLDRTYEHLHAKPADLHRLLVQLQSDGPASVNRLLSAWPEDQHDLLLLSLTWLAKIGCINWSHPLAKR